MRADDPRRFSTGKWLGGPMIMPRDREGEAKQAHRKAMERDLDSFGFDHPRGKHAFKEIQKLEAEKESSDPNPLGLPARHPRQGGMLPASFSSTKHRFLGR